MKTLVLTRVFNTLYQKRYLITPEFIFLAYTIASWATRSILNYFLPQSFNGWSVLLVTFPISIIITIIFIWISYIQKIDWYGREKTGPIARIIQFCSKKNWVGFLIVIQKEIILLLGYFYF